MTKTEGSEANVRVKEHPIAPGNTGDNPEVFVCQDSHSATWWFGGEARVLYTFSEALSMFHLRTSREKTETL